MLTNDQIVTQIINQLKLLDPTVSAEIGTPERKLIEAVAELIASQQVDFTVLNQQHDLSSMSGGRLDAYLSVYNFGRQQATPSYGTVRFSREFVGPAITIPRGTSVTANTGQSTLPTLTFVTTDVAVLDVNSTSVDAPIQCTIAGTVGNIDANTITGFGGLAGITGITLVTNPTALTGGTDAETDDTYRARFQNTFLRNISGTTDMFLALAVSANSVTKANIVGPVSRYQEYVQVPAVDDANQTTGFDGDGVQATALLTSDNTEPADGDTVTINNITYRFKNSIALVNDVHRTGVNADADLTNLIRVVNGTGTPGVDYFTGSAQPTGVTAGAVSAHTVTFTAISYGAAANSFPSTETSGHLSFGDTTFDGGVDGVYNHKRTSAESTIPYSKHTYTENYYVTDGTLDPANAVFFLPGVDFVFNTPPWDGTTGAPDSGNPFLPDVTFLNPYGATNPGGNPAISENDVLFMEHAYMSVNSRNDVSFGILNAIDVFINGEQDASADSVEIVPGSANALQNTNNLLWTYQHPTSTVVINFKRAIDGRNAVVGNYVLPLFWQPVLDIPDTLEIGTDTYYKANYYNSGNSTYYNQFDGVTYSFPAHYILVQEVNELYGTIRCRNGIEFFLSGPNYLQGQLPSDSGDSYSGSLIDSYTGTEFEVDGYLYDKNISDLQAVMESNKQVTQDVLVHRAKERYFRPMITVMYSFGATKAVVDASIIAALDSFFQNQYYGAAIQLSDILQTIHNVAGVDNVRWTNPDTAGNKLEEVAADGETLPGGPFWITADFFIQDNELAASPSDDQVTIVVRAQNTFGT